MTSFCTENLEYSLEITKETPCFETFIDLLTALWDVVNTYPEHPLISSSFQCLSDIVEDFRQKLDPVYVQSQKRAFYQNEDDLIEPGDVDVIDGYYQFYPECHEIESIPDECLRNKIHLLYQMVGELEGIRPAIIGYNDMFVTACVCYGEPKEFDSKYKRYVQGLIQSVDDVITALNC